MTFLPTTTSAPAAPLLLFKRALLIVVGLPLLIETIRSLTWSLNGDTAYLHYAAYLITEHGFVPYRDIFEFNPPGTYLFHTSIGRLFGYSDLAFRIIDLIWFSMTLLTTWLLMKPLGREVAIGGGLLFGTIYIGWGPYMGLQREFIAILPISTALLLAANSHRSFPLNRWNSVMIGICFAAASLIKPHLIIGLPVILLYSVLNRSEIRWSRAVVRPLIASTLHAIFGLSAVYLAALLWLWQNGSMTSFFSLFSSYVPLYNTICGDFVIRPLPEKLSFMLREAVKFGGYIILVLSAAGGIAITLRGSESYRDKLKASFIGILIVTYAVYAASGAKLWPYHWLPFIYFSALGTGLLLSSRGTKWLNIFGLIAFAAALLLIRPPYGKGVGPGLHAPYVTIVYGQHTRMDGRVDEISRYLKENSNSSDKIQPLCCVSGATHAMLIAERVMATPYIADLSFYHHVSTDVVQSIRKDFIERLKSAPPALFIDVSDKPTITGDDVSYSFPELTQFIESRYEEDYSGDEFKIYRLKGDSIPVPQATP